MKSMKISSAASSSHVCSTHSRIKAASSSAWVLHNDIVMLELLFIMLEDNQRQEANPKRPKINRKSMFLYPGRCSSGRSHPEKTEIFHSARQSTSPLSAICCLFSFDRGLLGSQSKMKNESERKMIKKRRNSLSHSGGQGCV